MDEKQREEIRAMLLDIIDNMEVPWHVSKLLFKRRWLEAVAEIATEEASK